MIFFSPTVRDEHLLLYKHVHTHVGLGCTENTGWRLELENILLIRNSRSDRNEQNIPRVSRLSKQQNFPCTNPTHSFNDKNLQHCQYYGERELIKDVRRTEMLMNHPHNALTYDFRT